MMAAVPQPLVVEGKDDHHSILHLLLRNKVLKDESDLALSPIKFFTADSKEGLLRDIPVRRKSANITSIGYVIDADDVASTLKGFKYTWAAVRSKLELVGVSTGDAVPPEGFIGEIAQTGQRIGVWVMPNNMSDGALEEFLISQIEEKDAVFQFASEATHEVASRDFQPRFTDQDTIKATLRCWLAWQKEPGQPYGTAMKSGRFSKACENTERFLAWVRKLYDIR